MAVFLLLMGVITASSTKPNPIFKYAGYGMIIMGLVCTGGSLLPGIRDKFTKKQ
jgi:hypothetical protein